MGGFEHRQAEVEYVGKVGRVLARNQVAVRGLSHRLQQRDGCRIEDVMAGAMAEPGGRSANNRPKRKIGIVDIEIPQNLDE